MDRLHRHFSISITSLVVAAMIACNQSEAPPPDASGPGADTVAKTAAAVRAARRAYDGAPPVIPHQSMGADCTSCHTRTGIQFGEMGFAPPMPHEAEPGRVGQFARCGQCHVYQKSTDVFVVSTFEGLRQDLRHGKKQHEFAPPMIPHSTFMRENCIACHTGPAAREEIRTPHPERARCRQCHVAAVTTEEFVRTAALNRPGPAMKERDRVDR